MTGPSNSASGFTLLELLVTLAIVGILSSVAIPSYLHTRTQAKIAQAKSDIRNIALAMEQLANDTAQWPGHQIPDKTSTLPGNEVWNLNAPSAGLVATDGSFPGWRGPYITLVQRDPWGMNYFLDTDYMIGGMTVAAVGSFGPNKCCPNAYDSDDVILTLAAQ